MFTYEQVLELGPRLMQTISARGYNAICGSAPLDARLMKLLLGLDPSFSVTRLRGDLWVVGESVAQEFKHVYDAHSVHPLADFFDSGVVQLNPSVPRSPDVLGQLMGRYVFKHPSMPAHMIALVDDDPCHLFGVKHVASGVALRSIIASD
jgi:hypothetical protein